MKIYSVFNNGFDTDIYYLNSFSSAEKAIDYIYGIIDYKNKSDMILGYTIKISYLDDYSNGGQKEIKLRIMSNKGYIFNKDELLRQYYETIGEV